MAVSHVLAIDLGTGGPKVAVVEASGRVLAWRSRPVRTTFVDGGGAEQDPVEMWNAVLGAAHDVGEAIGSAVMSAVGAVAVTSQYMSTIPVANDGAPTGPCVLWMDTRGAAHNLTLLTDESFMLFAERHGLIPLPSGNDNVAHAHVLRTFHADAYERATALVEPMDMITARLTGRVTATQSTVFGQLVCDNRVWGTTSYDDELVTATGLDPRKLAPLVPLTEPLDGLTAAAAEQLGLRAGIAVLPGTIDSITSGVGAGALDASAGSVVIGTTSVMVTHIDEHRTDLGAGLIGVPSPLPNRWYVMAENGLGGRAFEWALRLVGIDPTESGAIDRALAGAASITAGSDGVQFLPWLLGSIAPQPNDDVRAALVGLSLAHGRDHVVRATLEGVAANLAWLLPAVEAFAGSRWSFLRFGGGGAQSDLWAQVLADALGRPVHQLAEPRATNARGAALLALAQLGEIDLADAPAMLEVLAVRDPDPTNTEVMATVVRRLAALHPTLSLLPTS
jgi:xylulokinase